VIDRRSLRLRLLLSGGVGVLLASLALALWLGQAFVAASERAFDRDLAGELRTLIVLGEVDESGGFALQSEPEDEAYARLYSGRYWRVVAGDRQFQSRSLWDAPVDVPLPDRAGPARVHEVPGPGGTTLRAHVQAVAYPGRATPVVFVVAGDRAGITAEAGEFRLLAGGAVALVAVTLLLLVALQVGFALRPLTGLVDTAARVRRGESATFPTAGLPSEVAPLANHLNELLEHHDRSVQRARTAAQDLAHALKTPLAVLALEAERPGPALPARVQAEVARMRASIDRHLGRGVAADPRARTPVAPVVDALLALMSRVHAARGIAFARAPGADAVFAGSREDLEEMLGNLLDNAGKWARTRVGVRIAADGGRVTVRIVDDGPGLPAGAAAEAIGRGVRLDERTPGSGLGLAIVRDLADGYGGRLALASDADGLVASLELPAVD
jgi:signal transduction histidine kinase